MSCQHTGFKYQRGEPRQQVKQNALLKNLTAPRRAGVGTSDPSARRPIKVRLFTPRRTSIARLVVFGRQCCGHARMEHDTTEIAMAGIVLNRGGGCRGCRTPVAPPAATPSRVFQRLSLIFPGGVAGVAGESATIAPRACVRTCACTHSGLRSAATPATPRGSRGRFWRYSPPGAHVGRRGCLPPQPRHPRHPVAAGGGRYV